MTRKKVNKQKPILAHIQVVLPGRREGGGGSWQAGGSLPGEDGPWGGGLIIIILFVALSNDDDGINCDYDYDNESNNHDYDN